MENVYYPKDRMKPFLFGILAYRFKTLEDHDVVAYYGFNIKYGYTKLIGNLFVISKSGYE